MERGLQTVVQLQLNSVIPAATITTLCDGLVYVPPVIKFPAHFLLAEKPSCFSFLGNCVELAGCREWFCHTNSTLKAVFKLCMALVCALPTPFLIQGPQLSVAGQ